MKAIELHKVSVEHSKKQVPWEVFRVFGSKHISFMGDQISFDGADNDYVSLDELRAALEWLVKDFGGTVKWPKS